MFFSRETKENVAKTLRRLADSLGVTDHESTKSEWYGSRDFDVNHRYCEYINKTHDALNKIFDSDSWLRATRVGVYASPFTSTTLRTRYLIHSSWRWYRIIDISNYQSSCSTRKKTKIDLYARFGKRLEDNSLVWLSTATFGIKKC